MAEYGVNATDDVVIDMCHHEGRKLTNNMRSIFLGLLFVCSSEYVVDSFVKLMPAFNLCLFIGTNIWAL